MKTIDYSIKKISTSFLLLLTALAILTVSCKTSTSLPVLSTDNVTEITTTTAVSGGNITDDGGAAVQSRGICWSTSAMPTTAGSKATNGSGSGIFTATMTDLTPNTLYYARAFATNSAGTGYGNQVSFTTELTSMPELTTAEVTQITATAAISGGNITADGGEPVTARGVCWSTSQNPTIADSKTDNGTGTGMFESSLTGLMAGTTYYVKAYATNGAGTAYGNEVSFITTGGEGIMEVTIQGMAFNPSTISVSVNTTVRWTNLDAIGHTVTSNTGLFDSGTISPNGTFSFTFNAAGSYPYHCSIHTEMTGTVEVN